VEKIHYKDDVWKIICEKAQIIFQVGILHFTAYFKLADKCVHRGNTS
jgi:hypothetical protein